MTSNVSTSIPRSLHEPEPSSSASIRQRTGQSLGHFRTWFNYRTGRLKAFQDRPVQDGNITSQNGIQKDKAPQTPQHNLRPDTIPPPYHTSDVNTEISTTMTTIATALCAAAGAIPPGEASAATEVASIISILATAIAIVPGDQAHAIGSAMSRAIRNAVEVVSTEFGPDKSRVDRHEDSGNRASIFAATHSSDDVLRTLPAVSRETVRKMLPCAWACISKLILALPPASAAHVAIALNTAVCKVADAIAGASGESRVAVAVMYASSARRIADDSTRGIVTTEALEMSARLQGLDLLGAREA